MTLLPQGFSNSVYAKLALWWARELSFGPV